MLVLFLAGCLLFLHPALAEGPEFSPKSAPAQKELPKVQMQLNGETFILEVPLSAQEMLQGLMYRKHLQPKHGMLFRFHPSRRVNFWMKNTLIPLDMIFISRGQVVHVLHGVPPCEADPCPTYPSVFPVDTVVELPAGTAQQYAVTDGDKIQIYAQNAVPTSPLPEEAETTGQSP